MNGISKLSSSENHKYHSTPQKAISGFPTATNLCLSHLISYQSVHKRRRQWPGIYVSSRVTGRVAWDSLPRTSRHDSGSKLREFCEDRFGGRKLDTQGLGGSKDWLIVIRSDPLQSSTMSHERSTPSNIETRDFSSSPPTSRQDSQNGLDAAIAPDAGLTVLERWAVGRSETSFNTLAGAAGGFASGVITCPLDVIKTKLQGQGGFRKRTGGTPKELLYKGMVGTARTIWRDEGLKGMYRGLGPIILGYLPTWAVWFSVYGKSKQVIAQYNGMSTIRACWSVNICLSRFQTTRTSSVSGRL